MPPKPSIADVIASPDFQGLPQDEKVKFLGMLGPGQVPTPAGLGDDSNLDLGIRGPKGAYQQAAMGVGRSFGGASEDRSFLQTLNPIAPNTDIEGRAETLANLAQIYPISKVLKVAGMAGESLPITERLSRLLNRPITSTVGKTIESSGTKELTNATAQDFTSEVERNVRKGRNLQGQFAGKGTTSTTSAGNSQVNLASKLADVSTRQSQETTSVPLIQLLEQMNPKTALAFHAAAQFGPPVLWSLMRGLLANTTRAIGAQASAPPSPDNQ